MILFQNNNQYFILNLYISLLCVCIILKFSKANNPNKLLEKFINIVYSFIGIKRLLKLKFNLN